MICYCWKPCKVKCSYTLCCRRQLACKTINPLPSFACKQCSANCMHNNKPPPMDYRPNSRFEFNRNSIQNQFKINRNQSNSIQTQCKFNRNQSNSIEIQYKISDTNSIQIRYEFDTNSIIRIRISEAMNGYFPL